MTVAISSPWDKNTFKVHEVLLNIEHETNKTKWDNLL